MSRSRDADRPSARVVYSSGPGGFARSDRRDPGCQICNRVPCACEPTESQPPGDHAVRVRAERGGRKGKTVTVAGPLWLRRDDANGLLRDLKRRCGAGGTLKAGKDRKGRASFTLEIQGDRVERIVAELLTLGYPTKRSGG